MEIYIVSVFRTEESGGPGRVLGTVATVGRAEHIPFRSFGELGAILGQRSGRPSPTPSPSTIAARVSLGASASPAAGSLPA